MNDLAKVGNNYMTWHDNKRFTLVQKRNTTRAFAGKGNILNNIIVVIVGGVQ